MTLEQILVIAATAWTVWPPLGSALAVIGVLLCALRVLGGVHYPLDVVVGALVGILSAVIGYGLL
jgi:membrane-associated phospholipid phosphatase